VVSAQRLHALVKRGTRPVFFSQLTKVLQNRNSFIVISRPFRDDVLVSFRPKIGLSATQSFQMPSSLFGFLLLPPDAFPFGSLTLCSLSILRNCVRTSKDLCGRSTRSGTYRRRVLGPYLGEDALAEYRFKIRSIVFNDSRKERIFLGLRHAAYPGENL
jgi:hypothetical protein